MPGEPAAWRTWLRPGRGRGGVARGDRLRWAVHARPRPRLRRARLRESADSLRELLVHMSRNTPATTRASPVAPTATVR